MSQKSKLTDTNYLMWSLQVHALLDGYAVAGYLDEFPIRQDKLLYSALLGAISPASCLALHHLLWCVNHTCINLCKTKQRSHKTAKDTTQEPEKGDQDNRCLPSRHHSSFGSTSNSRESSWPRRSDRSHPRRTSRRLQKCHRPDRKQGRPPIDHGAAWAPTQQRGQTPLPQWCSCLTNSCHSQYGTTAQQLQRPKQA